MNHRLKATAILAVIVIAILYFSQLKLKQGTFDEQPREWWYTYHAVEPNKPEFCVDEVLEFVSDAEIKRAITLEWNDILFCKKPGQKMFRFTTNYETKIRHASASPRKISPWFYKPGAPGFIATCYLSTQIHGIAPLTDDPKNQDIKSTEFDVVNCDDN